MAFLEAHFYSTTLKLQCSANVLLPERFSTKRPLPCLWLLHGLSDDHTAWLRRTNIERYVANYNVAVIMPAVDRSFYADMVYGNKYWTYISDELPKIMRTYFRLSDKRSDNFVAGLSMGGHGAFKLALNYPDRYAAAASLSGVMDISSPWVKRERSYEMLLAFGKSGPARTNADLFNIAKQLVDSGQPTPKLFQCCGTMDFLYKDNLRFRDHARKIGLPVDYSDGHGKHEWSYWDARIQEVLQWLPLKKIALTL